MGTPNKFIQLLRDAFIPMVSRLAPFQHAFVQKLSELGIGYRGSPIVEGPGTRYFDDSIRGGDGIRSRFLLLLNADTAATEAAKQLFQSFDSVLERRISVRPGITLVRPDGYVASSSDHSNRSELESVRSLLQKQVTQPDRTRGAS
jgi:hypothetical protein